MITQHYSFRCDAPGCDHEEIDVTTMPMDWELAGGPSVSPPRPVLPKGWTRLNDQVLCPAHMVSYS